MARWPRRLAISAAVGALLSPGPIFGLRTHADRASQEPHDGSNETQSNLTERIEAHWRNFTKSKSCHELGLSEGCNETSGVPDLTLLRDVVEKFLSFPTCGGDASSVSRCRSSDGESCNLSDLRGRATSTLVYPGGSTRCTNNTYPEYAFQVFPGDSDKLYILFDGGGAEWDILSTMVGLANKTHVAALADTGLMRRGSDSQSPFKDYTIVVVQYCSGDLHAGDAVMPYSGRDDKIVKRVGYHNTMSAVRWALENMAPKLKSLVVSGASAGAIAAEIWAFKLLRTFQYESARIWADSYVPVFPPNFQGWVFQAWHVCSTDLLEGQPELQSACDHRELTVQKVFSSAMAAYPDVGFASVTSSRDGAQIGFYMLVLLTQLKIGDSLQFSAEDFEYQACEVIGGYLDRPNFVFFLREGSAHVFQFCDSVFDYTVQENGEGSSFVDWLGSFLDGENVASRSAVTDSTGFCRLLDVARPIALLA